MNSRAWCATLLVVLFLPLAQSVGAAGESTTPSQEDVLAVDSNTNLLLRPDAGGWGRIVLEAAEPTTLSITYEHDWMDITLFSRDGTGIYNDTVYTSFYVYAADEHPYSSGNNFEWWGDAFNAWWPHSGADFDRAEPIPLETGEQAIVLAANHVDGYGIRITADAEQPTTTHQWALGPNPDLLTMTPEPQENERLDAVAIENQDTLWETTVSVAKGIIKASASDDRDMLVGHAAASHDHLGWRPAGTPEPAGGTLPGSELTIGTASAQKSERTGLTEAADLTFARHLRATDLGIGTNRYDAQFLAIPTESMAD